MKIVFSPSKTQKVSHSSRESSVPVFQSRADDLVQKMRSFSEESLQEVLRLPDKMKGNIFSLYQNFNHSDSGAALTSFTGTAFNEIGIEDFTKKDWEFAQEHIIILSALYGVLRPLDSIQQYRLDMNDKIFGEEDEHKNLYDFWKEAVSQYFDTEQEILNLASGEYSKMLSGEQRKRMVTVDFLVQKDDRLVSVSVYSKQQRGKMLRWIIQNRITDLSMINAYESDGFSFREDLSDEKKRVFVKKD